MSMRDKKEVRMQKKVRKDFVNIFNSIETVLQEYEGLIKECGEEIRKRTLSTNQSYHVVSTPYLEGQIAAMTLVVNDLSDVLCHVRQVVPVSIEDSMLFNRLMYKACDRIDNLVSEYKKAIGKCSYFSNFCYETGCQSSLQSAVDDLTDAMYDFAVKEEGEKDEWILFSEKTPMCNTKCHVWLTLCIMMEISVELGVWNHDHFEYISGPLAGMRVSDVNIVAWKLVEFPSPYNPGCVFDIGHQTVDYYKKI